MPNNINNMNSFTGHNTLHTIISTVCMLADSTTSKE